MKQQLLIKNCTLATFFNDGYNAIKILEHTDILIRDGKIERIDPDIQADCRQLDGTGKLAVPGLINGRSRSLAYLLSKDFAEDMDFDLYGNTPLYARVNPCINIALDILSDSQLADLLNLALYLAIDSGTTTLFEQCSVRELPIFLEQCSQAGVRTVAFPMMMSRTRLPEADGWGVFKEELWTADEDRLLDWNEELVRKYPKGGLVQAGIGLHSADTLTESLMRGAAARAYKLNCKIMVTMNETLHERQVCQERYGTTPARILHKNHVLHSYTLACGNQYTDHEERMVLKGANAKAVVCPLQSMLDAETTPFIDFLIDDIPVLTGSGRCSVDMTRQMQASALNGKLESKKRYQMRAQDAFYASTIGGGRVMQLPIGGLEEGYEADIILIDLKNPKYHPLAMPVKELVYNTQAGDIKDVIINGVVRKQDGHVVGMNGEELVKKTEAIMEQVWEKARETGVF